MPRARTVAALALLAFASAGCPQSAIAGLIVGAIRSASSAPYAPGAIANAPFGRRLDHCVEIKAERFVHGERDADFHGFAVRWTFGNTCDLPTSFDMTRLLVWSEDAGGARRGVTAYDPGSEIHAQRIDAFTRGEEVIQYYEALYVPVDQPSDVRVRVCFDVTNLTPHAANAARIAPICMPLAGAAGLQPS